MEVQELRFRQQEQVSVYDLWAEKIVCRGRDASHGPESPKTGEDGKQGNPVRQHLEEVASKLAVVAAGRDSHQAVAMQTSDGKYRACKANLTKLEAALRAMPEDDEDFATDRAAIAAKIAETKSSMAENKPMGARIDAARGRLTRAQQRAKEASEALDKGQRVVAESDVEIACIERELHDLEAAPAHDPAVPAAIGMDNTVDAVSGQLQRLLDILEEGPGVDPKPGVSSYSSFCTALCGVSTCLREIGAATWSSSGPLKRLRGKQAQKVRPRMTIRTRTVKRRVGKTGVAMNEEISEL